MFKCKLCNKKFKTKRGLGQHTYRGHKKPESIDKEKELRQEIIDMITILLRKLI